MDQGRQTDHLLDLVLLQMADEMQRRALIGALAVFLQHLLYPVFPADIHACGDGLAYPVRIVHLGGGHQLHGGRVPAGRDGGGADVGFYRGHIFGDTHSLSFFLLIH